MNGLIQIKFTKIAYNLSGKESDRKSIANIAQKYPILMETFFSFSSGKFRIAFYLLINWQIGFFIGFS